ncbi:MULTISPECIES: helix-turn-helix domain-containing protein [Streptomyces]|uniref:Helix-turn-helix domain-containing protein n=1 Tax=Streptomyces doudnae TaxID=3075536 RepID=A0ABD5ENZ4_9ACTN|nr:MULTISPECIES: helix-turn-helix domain-containing protein [unclassified Streptomyces]MDT0436330.1 helix-turn-helix domain-containing protein [Streptomyces sp. DSM 41981]MYQ65284.1 helix-turn-helix domain-containing protein [Streptomyces sp. SID4950]SCD96313.1 AraC-type DNA-binding protein [Streptomyces sp. SolWspMP-5a-2]
MIGNLESFQDELAASGFPPLANKLAGPGFRAGIATHDLGPLRLVSLDTPESACVGRERDATDGDNLAIKVMTRGRTRIEQGRGVADLGPGDLVLLDPTRTLRFESTASTHVTVLVPRRELRIRPAQLDRLVGARIDGSHGPGALVSVLARESARSASAFREAEALRSAAAVVELIAVALESRLGDEQAAPDAWLRSRIVGYIETRLANPGLSPPGIAAAHNMSVRRLHKLFEDQPLTVAALIRRRRLERCRAELTGTGRTVTAVAARWGFSDPTHFSKLFKATYGYNARALTTSNRARTARTRAAGRNEDGGDQGSRAH